MRGGSRTFFAASLLLPRKVFEPAAALYAFCRVADDAIDIDGSSIETLRQRLRCAYQGTPLPYEADRPLADMLARHAIPPALPEALLEGFAWDAQGRRYESFEDLLAYAARVAGSVGAMMALLMGVRAPDAIARACDLGIAMQLSNIARDIGEDARAGRLYLPLHWLREAGIDPDSFVARPIFSAPLGDVVDRLLREADILYARAAIGINSLPAACRPGINAARLMYAEIGREVARRRYNSVATRAVVPRSRKVVLLGRACLETAYPHARRDAPVLAAARFLVDAAVTAPLLRTRPHHPVRKSFDERAAWLIDLFVRLGEREQLEL
jgi:phytoene synthase